MFIKIVLLICGTTFQSMAQDTTYFPWVKDGQLCQINAAGDIKYDSTLTTIEYPKEAKVDELTAYEYQGFYGFKNENGQVVIKAGYERVGRFREGFAWVKLDYKRYYYINSAEEPLINFTFDRCFDFQNGMARVFDKSPNKGHNGFGYINNKGKIVIPLTYKKAFDFVNGHALVKDKNELWWLIDAKGQQLQGPCKGLYSRKNTFFKP